MAIVETIGGATSNSYVTLVEAAAYFAAGNHLESASWLSSSLSNEQREACLIQACRDLNLLNYWGCIVTQVQVLKFPRVYRNSFFASVIPDRVKQAQMEQALVYAKGLLPAAEQGQSSRQKAIADGVASMSLGDLSESYRANAFSSIQSQNPASVLSSKVLQILSGYIRTTFEINNPERFQNNFLSNSNRSDMYLDNCCEY